MTLINAGDVKLKDGWMSDVAPTILELIGIKKPEEMTGESLIE
jgi:2,3-bisphosphoglycerate-independent phosphoglycerate mutase